MSWAFIGAVRGIEPALYYAWEEPLVKEPEGVYMHDDGRPMLGRKLKGKSNREMASLGLSLDDQSGSNGPST